MSHSIFLYIFLIFMALLFVIAALYVYFLKSPSSSQNFCTDPTTGQQLPPMWQRPDCDFLTESYSDPTIATPVSTVYLGDFYYSEGSASGAFCSPAYYAYRYVRIADGGYGPLSPWTSQGVASCACQLPCYPPNSTTSPDSYCDADGILLGSQTGNGGVNTCAYNTPVLVLMDSVPSPYQDMNTYILNVHRQVGTLDPTAEGELVGYFIVTPTSTAEGWYATFTDAIYGVSTPGTICSPTTC